VADQTALRKNNYSFIMTWEALDLSSPLYLSWKLVRINLPESFDEVVSVTKKCKVNTAEYTCIH